MRNKWLPVPQTATSTSMPSWPGMDKEYNNQPIKNVLVTVAVNEAIKSCPVLPLLFYASISFYISSNRIAVVFAMGG